MSQERTEQRDWAKDREIIEAATPGIWRRQNCLVAGRGSFAGQVIADCGGGFKSIDESNAIYVTESRTAWPAALDEIDRLNAVIAALNAEVEELDELNSVVNNLTAKVQERDAYIAELEKSLDEQSATNGCVQNILANGNRNLEARIEEQLKEIERLRAVMEKARIGLSVIRKWSPTGTHIESYAEEGRAMLDEALKGAE